VFETDDRPGCVIGLLPLALSYFLQLLLSYPFLLLAIAPFSFVLSRCGLSGEHPGRIHFAGYDALLCLFIGPVIGWAVGRRVPWLASAGCWIWFLPALGVLPDIVDALFRPEPVPHLPDFIFATGGKGSVGVDLFTLPACAAAGYSLGMVLSLKRPLSKVTLRQVVTLVLAGAGLFSLLAAAAHGFEQEKFERWSRVRTVIDHSGLKLSHDARLPCASPFNGSAPVLLPDWTQVETLGRSGCENGHLIDVDSRTNVLTLEKVRVLTGSYAGTEGWVCSYGLGDHF